MTKRIANIKKEKNEEEICQIYIVKILTPTHRIWRAIRLTTILQKYGGGAWDIRAADAEDKFSPPPVDNESPTISPCN